MQAEAPSKGWLQGESLGFFLFMKNLSLLTSPRWVLSEVGAGGAAGPAGCVPAGMRFSPCFGAAAAAETPIPPSSWDPS